MKNAIIKWIEANKDEVRYAIIAIAAIDLGIFAITAAFGGLSSVFFMLRFILISPFFAPLVAMAIVYIKKETL
jgi:hypothetical protein